jgi:hypothetical protein
MHNLTFERMSKQLSTEYIELKTFLLAFFERFMPNNLPQESQPLLALAASLEAMEQTAPTRAFAGLRMAVNDCIEMSSHWPAQKVSALDSELMSLHIVTLSQVRHRYSAKYASLLKRGRIKNEVEYYLLQGVLVDQALELAVNERKQLEAMVVAYEQHALTLRSSSLPLVAGTRLRRAP